MLSTVRDVKVVGILAVEPRLCWYTVRYTCCGTITKGTTASVFFSPVLYQRSRQNPSKREPIFLGGTEGLIKMVPIYTFPISRCRTVGGERGV